MANKVTISNIAEFRAVAAQYGVDMPASQGRPPVVKLRKAILAAGDEIVPTAYFTGEAKKPVPRAEGEPAPVKVTEYVVSARLPQKVKGEVRRYAAKGKHADKAGQPIPQNNISRVTITSAEVRDFARANGKPVSERGRVSDALTVPAAAEMAGWGDVDLLSDVTVSRV